DWDDEEATFEHPNLSLNLPKNVQDSLNRQLLVYDLFTEYNVKSLNDDGTVTFFDEIPYYGIEGLEDSFYSFKKLKADGKLYSTFTAKDENGQTQKYRIPTFGEAQLLVTHYPSMFPFDYDENLNPYVRLWYDSRLNGNEFTETVYLKNDENGNYKADITDESDGFTGVTELRNSKRESTKVYYNESTLPAYSLTPIDGYKSYTYCPCYGIRFKNTKQCAAYKWELKHTDTEPMNFYLSIKIKALPKDSDITVSDITDNNSYWNKGYLEYNIPIIGERNANSGQMVNIPRAYFITSSMKNSTNYIYFGFYVTSMYITNYNIYNSIGSLPLRLVKVKEPAESTQPAE
ncbi:MAG: hypothetical protein K2M93_07375, partial [Muribaculaceae bacterium]|nr:hypothetical protein [Muribaculaceae bacterium]